MITCKKCGTTDPLCNKIFYQIVGSDIYCDKCYKEITNREEKKKTIIEFMQIAILGIVLSISIFVLMYISSH